MTVRDFRDALVALGIRAYHYAAPSTAPAKYLVWGETGSHRLIAGDKTSALCVTGELLYYTDTEYDAAVDTINDGLDGSGAAWGPPAFGYDAELERFTASWTWEISCEGGIYG